MRRTESIDVMDALGSHIRVDTRDLEVMRILPRVFDPINEEWLADKARFAYDGLLKNRLDRPYVRNNAGHLEEVSWENALNYTVDHLQDLSGKEIGAISGDMADAESLFCLKELMEALKSPNLDCRQDGSFSAEARASYVLNVPIADFDKVDCLLLVGCNPRVEAPILNARLRKAYTHGSLETFSIGARLDLTYPSEFLSCILKCLSKFQTASTL